MRALAGALAAPLLSACILVNPDFDVSVSESLTDAEPSTETASGSTTTTVAMTGETVDMTGDGSATTTMTTMTTSDSATTTSAGPTTSTATDSTTDGTTTTGDLCRPSAPPAAGAELVIAAEYSDEYSGYVLGQVPGLPPDEHLGGIAIAEDDEGTLLVAGYAESPEGGLYQIKVIRGECGHIIAYDGEATLVAEAENISDILVLSGGPIFYSEWDTNFLAQRVEGVDMPIRTNLGQLTPPIQKSVAGFGLVPPGLAAAGELRVLSWDTGDWYHLVREPNGDSFTLSAPTYINSLPNKSGGVAYVPAGSPGFAEPHVVITRPEQGDEHVVVYQVDAQGDPILETRKVLLAQLDLASNVFFDRVTGDLLLSTIEAQAGDRIYIVQGFAAPPPLQE